MTHQPGSESDILIPPVFSFMAHPEMMLPIPDIDDPTKRFLAVVKFYLSGWHIKPPYGTRRSLLIL